MGVCYTVIMMDEFNWDYEKTSKKQKMSEFVKAWKETEVGYPPKFLGKWYGYVVWDIGKRWPEYEPYKKIIKQFSDKAWYIPDDAFYDLKELE